MSPLGKSRLHVLHAAGRSITQLTVTHRYKGSWVAALPVENPVRLKQVDAFQAIKDGPGLRNADNKKAAD